MSDLIAELHALAQRMAAAGETDEPVTVSLAAEEIERLRGEVEKLTRRNGLIIEEAEREGQHNRQLRIERFRQFGNEDCWIYGGDDHDNLETLVCPVVMSPQHLIEILQERDQLKAEVEQLQAQLNAAKRGMDSAAAAGRLMLEKGQKLAAENSPEAIESEREANAVLTAENQQLQTEVERLRAAVQAERSVKETIVAQRNRAYEVNDTHLKRISLLEQERDQFKRLALQLRDAIDENDDLIPITIYAEHFREPMIQLTDKLRLAGEGGTNE